MSNQSSQRKSIISLIIFLVVCTFGFGLGYVAMNRSGDIRSHAAEEDYVVKKWEFDTEDSGWVGSGLMLRVSDGKLKTSVTTPNTAKIAVSNTAALLTRGKKKITLGLAVTYPSGGSYTFRLRWKAKNGTRWSSSFPVKGTADGTMRDVTVIMPNTLSNFVVDAIDVQFTGAPKDAKVDFDYIRVISTKAAGTISKVGKLDAASKLTVSAKESYQLTAGDGVNFASYKGKNVRVSGKLVYSGANYTTRTINVTKIENAEEEVVIKDWGFIDNGEWSATNAKMFMVDDGSLELTVGSDGTANISNGTIDVALPSGKKHITFDAAVTLPNDDKPVFTLLSSIPANWNGKKVDMIFDGNEHTYTVELPDSATHLKSITLRATGMKEDAVISVGSMTVSVVKAAGTITKVGNMSKKDGTYVLTVNKKVAFTVLAGASINLDNFVGKYVRATGTLSWSADGKSPIVTVSSIEAAEEEVSVKDWLFDGIDPYDTEGWYADNLSGLFILGGSLRAGIGSVANGKIVNSEVELPISAGKKRIELSLNITGELSANSKFTMLVLPAGASGWAKYPFAVSGDGAEHTYSITLPETKAKYTKLGLEFNGAKQGSKILINAIRILAIKPAGTIVKTGDLNKVQDTYVLTVSTRVNKNKVTINKFILETAADSGINFDEYVGKNVDVNGKLDNSVTKAHPVISVLTIE